MPKYSILPLLLLTVGFAAGLPAAAQTTPPIALNAENSHYFQWRGEPTVLVTSGEHYGAVLNLDFDYVAYLDTLAQDGLNHTRTFSGVYREAADSFNITGNTLAPSEDRYTCPWARSDQAGYAGGGNRFDLERWDQAYFDRLKDFLRQASERGIVVELTLFCPMYKDAMWELCPMNADNNVNGVGSCPREQVYTLNHPELLQVQLAVTRKLVSEMREFDNLYYEICNEPYFGGVTMEWQHAIIDAIVEAESKFDQQHLISLNIANGRARVEEPHPHVSIFNFHYCVPPDTVAMNWDLNKVIGENETGFRGQQDVLYRTEGWDFLLAGGALYNNLDYSFTAQHSDGSLRDYKSPGGGSPELRQQVGILKRFLDGFELVKLRPDDAVIESVTRELTVSALGEAGEAYAIYMHVPLSNKPRDLEQQLAKDITAELSLNLPRGDYIATWIDTKTGEPVSTESLEHAGGVVAIDSPRFDNDLALKIVSSR